MNRMLAAVGLGCVLLSSGCTFWIEFYTLGKGGTGGTGGDGGAAGTGGTGGAPFCSPGEKRACYTGPEGTEGQGICQAGEQACDADGGAFGPCEGEVTPAVENCAASAPEDEDCNGLALVCEGQPLWGFRVGDEFQQKSSSVATDASGSVIVAGGFIGAMDFGGTTAPLTSMGGVNIFCAKLDAAGSPLWALRFGEDVIWIEADAATDATGNVLLAGHFSGTLDIGGGPPLTSAGATDAFVAKLDANGTPVWSRRFGGQGSEFVYAVAVDPTGNILLAGNFTGTVDFGSGSPLTSAGPSDVFVAKLDASGAPIWARSSGDAQGSTALAVGADGSVVLAGYFSGTVNFGGGPALTSAGATDVFVVKLDPDGTPVWARRFGDEQGQGATGVATDASGGVVVTGYFNGAVDFGDGPPLESAGQGDVFVTKLDASGAPLWARRFGDEQLQISSGVATDASGAAVVAGYFNGTVDFGSGPPLESAGQGDVFVTKLDASGAPLWARRFGDATYQEAAAIAVSPAGSIAVTGHFDGAMEVADGQTLASEGNLDAFALMLGP